MNDAVKIARSEERAAMYNCVRDVLTNPALDVIAGFILIEYLQGHNENGQRVAGGGFMGNVAGTALETGLVAYLIAPSVGETAKTVAPLIQSLAPLLLAAGG
jgi:hypothetical protein